MIVQGSRETVSPIGRGACTRAPYESAAKRRVPRCGVSARTPPGRGEPVGGPVDQRGSISLAEFHYAVGPTSPVSRSRCRDGRAGRKPARRVLVATYAQRLAPDHADRDRRVRTAPVGLRPGTRPPRSACPAWPTPTATSATPAAPIAPGGPRPARSSTSPSSPARSSSPSTASHPRPPDPPRPHPRARRLRQRQRPPAPQGHHRLRCRVPTGTHLSSGYGHLTDQRLV